MIPFKSTFSPKLRFLASARSNLMEFIGGGANALQWGNFSRLLRFDSVLPARQMQKLLSIRLYSSWERGSSYRFDRRPANAQSFGPKSQQKKKEKPLLMRDCEFLYGVQPVLAAIKAKKRRLETLYLLKDANFDQKERADKLESIQKEYEAAVGKNGPAIEWVDAGRLESMAGRDRPHQGVVLEAEQLDPPPIDFLEPWKSNGNESPPLWVALDRIQDPQNLGAIMRSCVYFGVAGIVPTEGKSSPLNATVSKASAGALEWAPVFSAGNFARFLKESKQNGWRIVGTAMSPKITVPASQVQLNQPTILVLGNEGFGVRSSIFSICDTVVRIPSFTDKVDSLNVSTATAILLYELNGRRGDRTEPSQ